MTTPTSDAEMLAAVDLAMASDAELDRDSEPPPPVTKTRVRAVCTQAEHETAKRPSRFPKLALVGRQTLGDLTLELRNCACGSTLAKEIKQ